MRLACVLAMSVLLVGCTQAVATRAPSAPASSVGTAASSVATSAPASAAPASSAPAGASAAPSTAPGDTVSTSVGLAQIRGHLAVSLALLDAGDQQGALLHSGHPIAEILPGLKAELTEHGVDVDAIDRALRDGSSAVNAKAPSATIRDAYARVTSLTEAADRAMAGTAADSTTRTASVVAALLATAGREYEGGIANGKVAEVTEYQDAFGFVQEAKRLYAVIASDVRAHAAAPANEIDAAFAALDKALAGPTPPVALVAADELQDSTALIGHELAEAVGSAEASAVDRTAIVAQIERTLDEMVAAYRSGNTDSAMNEAAEAYLEGYEKIEADVINHATRVNDELEPLLGSQLRAKMREGAPVAEVETMVARAKVLLGQALTAIDAMSH